MRADQFRERERQILELLTKGLSAREIAHRLGLSKRAAVKRIEGVLAKIAAAKWRRTFDRIKRFIEIHGHSRVPEGYKDEFGPLRPLVDSIRRHYPGPADDLADADDLARARRSPYPGIDFVAELNQLPGWEW